MIKTNLHSPVSTAGLHTEQNASKNADQYKVMSNKQAVDTLTAYSGKLDTAAGVGEPDKLISNKDLSVISKDGNQPMELRQAATKALDDTSFRRQLHQAEEGGKGLLSFQDLEHARKSLSKQAPASESSSVRPYLAQATLEINHYTGFKEIDEILHTVIDSLTSLKNLLVKEEFNSRPSPEISISDKAAHFFKSLINGEFNHRLEPQDNTWDTFKNIEGWDAATGQIDLQKSTGYTSVNSAVELDSSQNSTISQEINAPKSGRYQFGLDYAMRSGDKSSNGLEVYIDGKLMQTVYPKNDDFSTLNLELNFDKGKHSFDLKAVGKSDDAATLIDNVRLQRYKGS